MKPEGENIIFDLADKSRYSGLPPWVPIEAAPGLYAKLSERQDEARRELDAAQDHDVMDVSEHIRQHKLAAAHRRIDDLGVLKTQLGELAPDAIADSIPLEEVIGPGFEVTVLHQK